MRDNTIPPVRYYVILESGRKYRFRGSYKQHEAIAARAAKRGERVNMIASWSTSTGKAFPDWKP